jgi:putative NADH-flavin reductase
MNILLFGATGLVGSEILRQALEREYTITAFARNVNTLQQTSPQITVIQGDVLSAREVEQAIQCCNSIKKVDAVISALGGEPLSVRSAGVNNILAALDKSASRRFIGIGGMGILYADTSNSTLIYEFPDYPPFLKEVSEEHRQALRAMEESSTEWTFFCPPRFVTEPATGAYRLLADYMPDTENDIATAYITVGDLAKAMLEEASNRNFIGKRVGIRNIE